ALAALALVLTACTTGAGSGADGDGDALSGVPEAAREVMDRPRYADGRWQITATDVDTGDVLVDIDGDRMAEPGSFVKTYSVGAAWLAWGPDHTLVTPVKRTGEVVDGVLQGDLVL